MNSIDVKQAVAAAQAYAKDLFPSIENVRLEEVELVDEGYGSEHWNITLSFQLKDDPDFSSLSTQIAEMVNPSSRVNRRPDHLKVFEVATDGKVRSMKIRKASTE